MLADGVSNQGLIDRCSILHDQFSFFWVLNAMDHMHCWGTGCRRPGFALFAVMVL